MHHNKVISRLLGSSAIVLVAGLSGAAYAQDAGYGLNDIIVTAQKREQSIQDVPIAVSALGEDTLQVNRVTSTADLTGLAPGLIARKTPGGLASPSFAMRGRNANASVPSQDRQISMYVDGVYIGGNRGTIVDMPDLERIEVLRGPQGTLFGRNSTAGAVQFITPNPTGKFDFRQDVTVGNQAQFRTRTTINSPALGPFSARVTYVHDEKRGDVRNLGAGTRWDRTNPFTRVGRQTSPKWLGNKNYESIFAALRFDNGGDVTVSYKFDWAEGKFGQEARSTPVVNPNDFTGRMLAGIIAAQPPGGGAYGPVVLNPDARRPDAINNAWNTAGFQRVQGHNLTIDWQVSDSVSLKNILSYRKNALWAGGSTIAGLSGLQFTPGAVQPYATWVAASRTPGFANLTPQQQGAIIGGYVTAFNGMIAQAGTNPLYFAPYEGQGYGRHWQISNETQVYYTSDRLTLTGGFLYYHGSSLDGGLPGFAANMAFQPFGELIPLGNPLRSTGKTDSVAVYAQAEYDITPQLGVVVGGRYTKDKKRGAFQSDGVFVGDRFGLGQIVGSVTQPFRFKKSKPTYSIGLNYKPNDDTLLYAKHGTAFLSGGAVADLDFPPETATSYELGVKSDLLDRKVRFNVAAYYVKYHNAQATTSGTAVRRPELNIAVITSGSLKAKGIEIDLNVAPFRGFSFGGTAGYTEAKWRDPSPLLDQGRGIVVTGVPKWVGSVHAMYVTQPLFGDATMLFRVDTTFQSKSRVIEDPQIKTRLPVFGPYEFIQSKAIVNGRVALRDVDMGGANVEVGLWARNLLNNRQPVYSFAYPNFLMTMSYEQARTYGLDVIVKFNP